MDQALINRIVEAALLAHGQPVSLAQLRELFPLDDPAPNGAIETALAQLREACADRGVELVEVASGFRYQVCADVHPWVARLSSERQTRYTRATLETLALIAYRQPITRGEIEQVRGVSVSSNTIKALEEREWIRVVGHRDVPGRPALFGTTKVFLDYFGLKRLDELPPLSELKDIGELEPQLQFDDASGVDARMSAQAGLAAEGSEATASGVDPRASTGDEATHVDAAQASSGDDANAVAGDADLADTAELEDPEDSDDDFDFRRERPVVFHDDFSAPGANSETASTTDTDHAPARSGEKNTDDAAGDVHPEAAPGMRAATENDHEQDNAVETTTVPATAPASIDAAEPN